MKKHLLKSNRFLFFRTLGNFTFVMYKIGLQ